jgi:hypothetical protein
LSAAADEHPPPMPAVARLVQYVDDAAVEEFAGVTSLGAARSEIRVRPRRDHIGFARCGSGGRFFRGVRHGVVYA